MLRDINQKEDKIKCF